MISNDIKSYWLCLDQKLDELVSNGYCFLPPINNLIDINTLSKDIEKEISTKVYASGLKSQNNFCKEFGISDILAPRLYDLAKRYYSFKGLVSDQYHIARKVKPGLSSEAYRGHFDSHCFTLVMPIKIPKIETNNSLGELVFFPNVRKFPTNEMINICQKIYFKRYASKNGFDLLSNKTPKVVATFQDHRPLIFVGNRTLHGNLPVSHITDSIRLTLLSHFFDPSPPWGIGNILRQIRSR